MPAIAERLKRQLAAKGEKDAESKAYAFLNKAGVLKGDKLTPKGAKRQAMGAAGRARDRAAKASGGSPDGYQYDKSTNRAYAKK
jgi:hypothetical protein